MFLKNQDTTACPAFAQASERCVTVHKSHEVMNLGQNKGIKIVVDTTTYADFDEEILITVKGISTNGPAAPFTQIKLTAFSDLPPEERANIAKQKPAACRP